MSDGGDIEVENSVLTDVLPKDVVKEVGNVKLFNKWDYDVEVRDISLTYVRSHISKGGFLRRGSY
jgi:small subunit ribosomal protein S5e